MIVVIGSPTYQPPETTAPDGVGGLGAAIAITAVAAGAMVQFVGKIGDDAAGDALVLSLGRMGVGHAAVLRDAGHPTPILVTSSIDEAPDEIVLDELPFDAPLVETMLDDDLLAAVEEPSSDMVLPESAAERPQLQPGDVDLALRYLTEFAVIVVADPLDETSAGTVAAGASYVGAQVVAIVPHGGRIPEALASATVLEAPSSDPDGAFARLVGGYAAALDAGSPPSDAFRAVVDRAGWEPAGA